MTTWTVDEPVTLEMAEPVTRLQIRLVAGSVDVVASSGVPRVEVSEVVGLPLTVRIEDGTLVVGYDDVVWATILGWLRHERRHVVVSIAIPRDCPIELGVVSASATVTGFVGSTSVRSVSGAVTLDGLSGDLVAETVSGDVETLALDGDLSFTTVSGDLTVVGGRTGRLVARTVSGSVTADLDPAADAAISLDSVSGDIGVRLPATPSLDIDLKSTSGDLRSSHDGLQLTKQPGRTALTGRLGDGGAHLRARTVSGDVALLIGADA